MDEVTREQLLQMIKDAWEACYSEFMSCPWCGGHIGYDNEWHDSHCLWLKVKDE